MQPCVKTIEGQITDGFVRGDCACGAESCSTHSLTHALMDGQLSPLQYSHLLSARIGRLDLLGAVVSQCLFRVARSWQRFADH
jgi:hypothetical protein